MTFEEWKAKYKPISIVAYGLFSQDYAELKDPRCSDNCNNLWTVVEVDNGDWIISNGFHLVNRVGYILTEVIWEGEEFLEVTYWLQSECEEEIENIARDPQ